MKKTDQLEIDLLCKIIEHCISKIVVVEPFAPLGWDVFVEEMGTQWRVGRMVREINALRAENKLLKDKIASDKAAVAFCSPMGNKVEDDIDQHMMGKWGKK